MNTLPLSIIILTYNEARNIRRCLESVKNLSNHIFIVDSYSTDGTLDVAREYTDRIYQHRFENQAMQFNWAIDNLPLETEWIMRLDADERLTPELGSELTSILDTVADQVNGLYIKRRVYFMGRWIRHGGYYPVWLLRVFRKGHARCEIKDMDEHIAVTQGRTIML
ncbi:MAG: glycosyltransferase family 2 protein, partial [Nitrospirota bacterium]